MKMFGRILLVLVVLLGIGYGAAELVAARYAEQMLADKVESKDALAKNATADVSTPLLWGLLTNNTIDRIELTTTHVQVGPLLADKAVAVLTGVHIDRAKSLKEAEVIVSSIDRLDMTVILSQESVSKALAEGVTVEFGDGVATLKALGLEVEGTLEVVGETAVAFVPNLDLPRGFPRPHLELADVPFVSCIRQILIEPGFVTVTCTKQNPPPDFPPG